jgi:predicted phosphodiesterase
MRIAVLADIHGNILALEAVLADLARRGTIDRFVNLGDCVAGPLWPRETAERLLELDWSTARGNHDRRVALDVPAEMGPSDKFAYDRLTPEQRDWLGALPMQADVAPSVLAFHARPDHDERYLTEAIEDRRLVRAPVAAVARRLKSLATYQGILLCGHSHRTELLALPGGPTIFNPGSVGCPAYDDPTEPAHVSEQGSPHARYGIVEIAAGGAARFEVFAVGYDFEAAAKRAEQAGRPEWAHGLRTGLIRS